MFYVLIVLAAASRLLPHPANFAPIGALGLFAGAYANRGTAWAVPLLTLLASDAILGFYNPLSMAFVYSGFAISSLLGCRFLRQERTSWRLGACSLGSGISFFLLSNFGCWVTGMYAHTWSGLGQCYVMAIPFFGNTLLGDVFYTVVLFGMYELAQQWQARRRAARLAS